MDLYTDFLICSTSYTTATELSRLSYGGISHDQVTRFLSSRDFSSKDLWKMTKKYVRQIESPDAVLIIDDTIELKPHTKVNEIVCHHYDHTSGKIVKGINIVNCIYHSDSVSLPIAYEIVHKPITYCDLKSHKEKQKSEVSKNYLFRQMLAVAIQNQVVFSYVLADIWYAASENMKYIVHDLDRDFLMSVKRNRLVARTQDEWIHKKFVHIEDLRWQGEPQLVWMKGVNFPLIAHKEIFTNKDGSTGYIRLVTSDLKCSKDDIEKIYQKRWNVETFHKTIKQNASLAKSPTRTIRTQSNHIFMSTMATVKLELLKIKEKCSHYALKTRLYSNVLKTAFAELQTMKSSEIKMFTA